MSPRVTVLMAVYNGEPDLRASVESVLSQSYDDLELLVVDDGSTDASAELVLSFGDPRIRLLQNERNVGQVPSLNRGLREARGEYVARLDHDDRSLPTRLERQVALLDADPAAALVGTWIDVVDSDGRLWTTVRGDIRTFPEFVQALLVNRFPFGHPSIMFRRAVALELGGYDETLAPAEDLDLYRRLALAGWGARVVREPLVLYLRHEAQMSQARSEVMAGSDARGHDRFLADLAPGASPAELRMLLKDEAGAWAAIGTAARGRRAARDLDELVVSGARRLRIDQGDLERFLVQRISRVTRRGWRDALVPWLRASPPLVGWTLRHSTGPRRLLRALSYVVSYGLSPLLALVAGAGGRGTRSLAHAPALASVRARAAQRRTLRDLYRRLVGTR